LTESKIDVAIIDSTTVVMQDSLGIDFPLTDLLIDPTTGQIHWCASPSVTADLTVLLVTIPTEDTMFPRDTVFEIGAIDGEEHRETVAQTMANDQPVLSLGVTENSAQWLTLMAEMDPFDSLASLDAPSDHVQLEPGEFDRVGWYRYWDQPLREPEPLACDPTYTGMAKPAARVLVKIFDDAGREVASRSVMADAGGNWLARFPRETLWELPHSMTAETVAVAEPVTEQPPVTRGESGPAAFPTPTSIRTPATQRSLRQDTDRGVTLAIDVGNHRPAPLHRPGRGQGVSGESSYVTVR
jgi:hypothetical protein